MLYFRVMSTASIGKYFLVLYSHSFENFKPLPKTLIKLLCSASNKGDDSSTGNSALLTDYGSSKVSDNTSAVISFKLPSVLESCGKKQVSCRRSNSSSSSDETDTIPLQASASNHWQRGSMSTQKPSVKSTPDFRSG